MIQRTKTKWPGTLNIEWWFLKTEKNLLFVVKNFSETSWHSMLETYLVSLYAEKQYHIKENQKEYTDRIEA